MARSSVSRSVLYTGGVRLLPNGTYQVRVTSGKTGDLREGYGAYETEELAQAVLEETLQGLNDPDRLTPGPGLTFHDYFEREVSPHRHRNDQWLWAAHLQEWAQGVLLHKMTPEMCLDFRDALVKKKTFSRRGKFHKNAADKFISESTGKHVVNLARVTYQHAIDRRVLPGPNPWTDIKVNKKIRELILGRAAVAKTTTDRDYVFPPEEQARLLACKDIPDVHHFRIAVAMGSGLRLSELHHLHLQDLHLDGPAPYIHVQHAGHVWHVQDDGSQSVEWLGTKSNEPREVRLFGVALAALREWLPRLPAYCACNTLGLVFPCKTGEIRQAKPYGFQTFCTKAGVKPRRWHSLRHTYGTALIAGWWGPPAALEDVQAQLGHSEPDTTLRYARIAQRLNAKLFNATTATEFVALIRSANSVPGHGFGHNLERDTRFELATPSLGRKDSEAFRMLFSRVVPSLCPDEQSALRVLRAFFAGFDDPDRSETG
jgi:integrase